MVRSSSTEQSHEARSIFVSLKLQENRIAVLPAICESEASLLPDIGSKTLPVKSTVTCADAEAMVSRTNVHRKISFC